MNVESVSVAEGAMNGDRDTEQQELTILFVDDREKNCVGARAVGMDAVRFVDTPTLRADLVERGFLGG